MTNAFHNATSAYRNVSLETRSVSHDPYQLVNMMFESVLESLVISRGAIESGDLTLKLKHINKAIRIIQEGLRTSLDLDNGGELAQNLAALYDYVVIRLTQANASNDVKMLQEVAELIKPISEAWSQMRGTPVPTAETSTAKAAPSAEPKNSAQRQMTGRGYTSIQASAYGMLAGA